MKYVQLKKYNCTLYLVINETYFNTSTLNYKHFEIVYD